MEIEINELQPGTIAVLGIPFDSNSSFRRGSSLAPLRIREGLYSPSTNLCTENGIDLGMTSGWQDVGDLVLSEDTIAFAEIEGRICELLTRGVRPITLGGDHSITYPILRAYAKDKSSTGHSSARCPS